MHALRINNYDEYYDFLRENPDELKELVKVLTINLSSFFRNPETFEYLKKEIFPELKKRSKLIFWSAGCASGEEPYTLAILVNETGILSRVDIYGTDIDDDALNRAKKGLYKENVLQYLDSEIKARYFKSRGDEFEIKELIKSSVIFLHHDLLQPAPFPPCDLIICRNVLIYLDRAAQGEVLSNFYNHLKIEGYLVLGKVELLLGIPEMKLFNVVDRVEHIYKKEA